MSPDRKIDRGLRGLAVAGMLLFPACGYNTATLEQLKQNQPIIKTDAVPTTVPQMISSERDTDPPVGSEMATIVQYIKSKYNVKVGAESWNINEELKILAATIDKIPGAGYLADGGISIKKDSAFIRSGGVQAVVPFLLNKMGFYVFLGAGFNPNSTEGVPSGLPHRSNQKEQLEWDVAWNFGYLFSEKVKSKLGPVDVHQDDPIYKTFAQIAGWEYGEVPVNVAYLIIEGDTSRVEYLPFTGWYHDLGNGRFDTNIYNAFGDYFATWIFEPALLPESAKRYFSIILQGLKGDPKQFIDQIRKDPSLLLQ